MKPIENYWIAKLSITSIFCVFVIIFYTIWTVKVIQHLIQSIKSYRLNKREDFRDSRERDRILYNYETHIVKDVIIIVLSCGEICEILMGIASAIFTTYEHRRLHSHNKVTVEPYTCEFGQLYRLIMTTNNFVNNEGLKIIWASLHNSIIAVYCIGFILLLSVLTQYLSRRYFNHSYRRTIIDHLLLFFIQIALLSILSNLEIYSFFILIVPILVMIDWCILARNSRKLRSVLESHLRDLDLHLTDRSLYKEQLKLLEVYAVFMPILLAALLFGVLAIMFRSYSFLIYVLFVLQCASEYPILSLLYKNGISDFHIDESVYVFSEYGTLVLLTIHFFLLGLPLYGISIEMFVTACIKRFGKKKQNYRYNYSHFPHLRHNY